MFDDIWGKRAKHTRTTHQKKKKHTYLTICQQVVGKCSGSFGEDLGRIVAGVFKFWEGFQEVSGRSKNVNTMCLKQETVKNT